MPAVGRVEPVYGLTDKLHAPDLADPDTRVAGRQQLCAGWSSGSAVDRVFTDAHRWASQSELSARIFAAGNSGSPLRRYGSARTQMFLKLIGSLGSLCAWSLIGAPSYAL